MSRGWAVPIIAVGLSQIAVIATSIYLHRTLAHQALRLHPVADLIFRVILWLTTGQVRQEWVAVHRKHHAFTDRVGDPHSPRVLGFWRVQLFNVYYYVRERRNPLTIATFARDLPADRLDRALFSDGLLGVGCGLALLWVVMGFWPGVVAGLVHGVLYVFVLAPLINAVGHWHGYRTFENGAYNSRILAWVTGGESLHNNHHAHPRSAKFSIGRAEFDPSWPVIRVLSAMRLLTIVRPRAAWTAASESRRSPHSVADEEGRVIGMATPLRSIDVGRQRGLEAAALVLATIGGFSAGEREMIVRFIKMGRVGVGLGSEGWGPPLTDLVDRVFEWPEFDRWHAFFTVCGIFPQRWDGLQMVPTATTSVAVAMKYRQRKLEFLLEWLDMLTRRSAELGHYTRRGRRVQIVQQEDDHRCSVCASFNGHEVTHGSDTMPPLHPGCRCVLMAAMTVPPVERTGAPPGRVRAALPEGRR